MKNLIACLVFANAHALGSFWISRNVCTHTKQCVYPHEARLFNVLITTTLDMESCLCFEEVSAVILSSLFPLRALYIISVLGGLVRT